MPEPPKEEIYALVLVAAALISGKASLSQGAVLARDAKEIVKELLKDKKEN